MHVRLLGVPDERRHPVRNGVRHVRHLGADGDCRRPDRAATEYRIIKSIFIETLVLLASSFTFGMATLALKYKRRPGPRPCIGWMARDTRCLGCRLPRPRAARFQQTMFSPMAACRCRSGYPVSVLRHWCHCMVCMSLAGCLWLRGAARTDRPSTDQDHAGASSASCGSALFWHFLDIVWIAIFSTVFLAGLIR